MTAFSEIQFSCIVVVIRIYFECKHLLQSNVYGNGSTAGVKVITTSTTDVLLTY